MNQRTCMNISQMILAAALAVMLSASGCTPARAQSLPFADSVWESLGPEGGDVISLAGGPGSTLYLGTADGHVFASDDAAAHWELRGRAGARLDGVVQRLLVDARNPQRLFAAVWFQDPAAGGGVFRSDDAGRTWALAGLRGEAVRALEQSASNREVLTAGTRSGVFRSDDGGASWERISPAGDAELRNLDSLALDPRDARVIYAGTYHLPWKTTDAGRTWTPVAAGMIDDSDIMSLRIDRQNPARLFASACSGIYRSENAGAQWIKLQGIPYAARRTQTILQDAYDPRVLYAGTTEGLWVSRDAGETWARITPAEWVINALAITRLPRASGERIILGTEQQGVLVTDDAGVTFAPANAGFSHRVIADLSGDPRDFRHLLARIAGPREPLLESRDAGKSWQPFPASLPAAGAKKLYGTAAGWWSALNGGGVARYDETAQRWQKLEFREEQTTTPPHGRSRAASRSRARIHVTKEADPDVADVFVHETLVYIATSHGVWSGAIREGRLRRMALELFPGSVMGIVVSRAGEDIYAVTPTRFSQTLDSGKTWNNVAAPPEAGELVWLAPMPAAKPSASTSSEAQPSWVVGTSNGVYRLTPHKQMPWELLQSGLPAARPVPPGFSAASMAIPMKAGGIYVTRDQGKNWERLDSDAQAGLINGIAADGQGGYFTGSKNEGILHLTLLGFSE
jgi:photosystem II stability/assembly factor-like uncharacterized protein